MPASVPPVPIEQMKSVNLAAGLLPDFRAGRNVMCLRVVQVVPLIGKQDAVRLGLAKLIGKAPGDVLVVVRIAVGQRRHLDELGATEPQRVLLFLALSFRNDDQGPVTSRIGDDRKTDPGIARGSFQDQAAGLQIAALLGFEDHLASRAVLHRLAGIHELGLAENGAAGLFGGPLQFDQRSVADCFDDVLVDVHCRKSCQSVATSGNDPRARLQKVEAGFASELIRLRKHHLADVDISREESGLAVGEVVFP